MTDQKPQAFLNRWSARKQQAKNTRAGSHADTSITSTSQVSELTDEIVTLGANPSLDGTQVSSELDVTDSQSGETAIEQGRPAEEELLLTDDDMPAIESLAADSDLSAFFNKGVSAALRKSALRHVFHLPQFNVRDGLNDYDGDYTVFEPLGDIVTSDMKWHIARKERARLEAEELAQLELEQQELEKLTTENRELEQEELEPERLELGQQELEQLELEQQRPEQQALHTANLDTEELGKQDQKARNQERRRELGLDIIDADAAVHVLDKQTKSDHLVDNNSINTAPQSQEALTIASKDANADTEINT